MKRDSEELLGKIKEIEKLCSEINQDLEGLFTDENKNHEEKETPKVRALEIAGGIFTNLPSLSDQRTDQNTGVQIRRVPREFLGYRVLGRAFPHSRIIEIADGLEGEDFEEVKLPQKILSLGKPVFCVPGNQEPYEILDLFDEYGVNIHNEVKKFKGVDFAGFGGAATPFNTKFEPTEEEIRQHLGGLLKNVKRRFVLVVHNPPYNTKLDKIQTKEHVGSEAIRSLIEKHKPILAISAHIHEAGGIDKLGESVLFYPGAAYDGFVGIAKIGKDVECEIKKL